MTDFLIRNLPPMSNEWCFGLASGAPFGVAEVARFRDGIDDPNSEALHDLMRLAVAGVENANSTFFRFEVETACEDDEPRLVRLTPSMSTRSLELGMTVSRSTRKLVALVVLAVTGEGTQLCLDGQDKSVVAQPGQLVIFPGYCDLVVVGPEGCSVEAAVFHALGPAFR